MDRIAQTIESFIRSILGLEDPTKSIIEILLPQLIAITILVVAVRFLLWNKVTELIDARRYYVESQIKDAEKHQRTAIDNETRTLSRLKDVEVESKAIIEEAKLNASRQAQVILDKAKEDADSRINRAMNEIETETKKAKEELKEEFGSLVLLAAEKIIEKEIDGNQYTELIEETVRGLN